MRLRLAFDPGIPDHVRERIAARLRRPKGPEIDVAVLAQTFGTEYRDIWAAGAKLLDDATDVLGVFASRRLPDNFFARTASPPHEKRMFVVHVDDYSWLTPAGEDAVAAHLAAKKLLDAYAERGGIDHESLFHLDPSGEGCAFDLCADKRQLARRLRTGDICNECLQRLEEARVPEDLLRFVVAILEDCRRDALHSSRFLPMPMDGRNLDLLPYPVAVTRHKAANERGDRQLQCLLDHFDALVRYICIVENARRSRSLTDAFPAGGPTLGWWVAEMGRLAKRDDRLGRAFVEAERSSIVAIRNDEAHSWTLEDDGRRAEAVDTLERVVSTMELSLRTWFAAHRLVIVKQNGIHMEGVRLHVRVEIAHGSNTIFDARDVVIPTGATPAAMGIALSRGAGVFAAEPDLGKFTPLSPLVEYGICLRCKQSALLLSDGRGRYLDTRIGHRAAM